MRSICSSERMPRLVKSSLKGLKLHVVPAYADAQGEATAAEHVNLGGLLGDQGGLTLGQDEDAGDKADALGDSGDEGQGGERLVDDAVVRVVVVTDVRVVSRGRRRGRGRR